MYKVVPMDFMISADKMTSKLEDLINSMEKEGWELVTMSATTTAKTMLVFKKSAE